MTSDPATSDPARGGRGGYRPEPAGASARIAWPDDWGTRFTVMVDTEEEFDWNAPFRRDAAGTGHLAAMPAVHARMAERGVALSYLVDHPVARCPRAQAILGALVAEQGGAIGAQLHPWVNPPFDEALNRFNSFAGNLPPALEAAKLAALTSAIRTGFGVAPRLFRAGRYGLGPATMAALVQLGYRADSSMRAGYDYSGEGGPDFSAIGNDAFRTGPAGAIVEIPLTTVFTGAWRRGGPRLYRALGRVPHLRGVAARLGLLSRVALTPEDMPIADAIEAVRVAAGEGVALLNFSFHSPSVEPGHTPYVRDAADLRAFHGWWDRMLDTLAATGARPIGLDALIDAAAARVPAPACGEGV